MGGANLMKGIGRMLKERNAVSGAGKAVGEASKLGGAGREASGASRTLDWMRTGEGVGKAGATTGEAGKAGRAAGEAGKAAEGAGKAAGSTGKASKGGQAAEGAGDAGKAAKGGEAAEGAGKAAKGGEAVEGAGKAGKEPGDAGKAAKGGKAAEGAQEAAEGAKGGRLRRSIKAHPFKSAGLAALGLSALSPDIGAAITQMGSKMTGNIVSGVGKGMAKSNGDSTQPALLRSLMSPAGAIATAGIAGKALGIGRGGILDTIETAAVLGGGAGVAYDYLSSRGQAQAGGKEAGARSEQTADRTAGQEGKASSAALTPAMKTVVAPASAQADGPEL